MRCFIAIDIPSGIRESLAKLIFHISAKSSGVKFVQPENIHITMKFLGEVDEKKAQDVIASLKVLSASHSAFSLEIKGAGVFPDPKRPNVLWVGIPESAPLQALYQEMEASLALLSFEKEARRFSPHLTIGRVKERHSAGFAVHELLKHSGEVFGSFEAREICLMQSVLKPSGAEYSTLATFGMKH